MLEIRPLLSKDCLAVAAAHASYLRTLFNTWGGVHLLQAHYEILTRQQGGICFVARVDSQFAGFVCGIWDHSIINQINRRKSLRLVFYGLEHVLERPAQLGKNLQSYVQRNNGAFHYPEGYELRPIVVLPPFRGQGIADALVNRLLQDAQTRGCQQVFLFTETDNQAAIRFYTRFGFVEQNSNDESRRMFCYFIANPQSS